MQKIELTDTEKKTFKVQLAQLNSSKIVYANAALQLRQAEQEIANREAHIKQMVEAKIQMGCSEAVSNYRLDLEQGCIMVEVEEQAAVQPISDNQ